VVSGVRSSYHPITDEDAVAQRIRDSAARTVVLDVEPLVASWDTSQHALDEGIARALSALAAVPGVRAVCFATNSARKPSALPVVAGIRVDYQASARKPLRLGPYADLPRPGVVVGDQIATDGVLAWRLGYAFVHFRPPRGSMPAGPAVLYGGGRLLRPLLFRRPERR
jgi:predicted HAD superfamily phosphohydrolase YqeG